MRLSQLLRQITYRVVKGTKDIEIQALRCDSRLVETGDVFVCIKGYETDGHRFLSEALARGASAVIIQESCPKCRGQKRCFGCCMPMGDAAVISVPDTRYALAAMAAAYFGYPARELTMIGITGTKGKTTTAYLIREGLRAAGRKAGLIGTVEIDTGKRICTCSNTTPESLQIQEYLREMADNGCDSAVMEVSSQALKLRRTEGICFAAGIFTNLGRDHIGPGEHADMEEYLQCKRKLFFQCETAVGNADDACLPRIWKGTPCRKVTYGILRQKKAYGSQKAEAFPRDMRRLDYAASDIVYTDDGSVLGVRCRVEGRMAGELNLEMPGAYNISNGLAAAAALREVGIPEDRIFPALERVRVPGRMEAVPVSFDCRILVDYAHNDMSLRQCLKTLKDYHPARLVAVFGCGGNRSRERRASMGEAAGKYADFTIITTDNPRYEPPRDIIKDIEQGIKRTDGTYIIIEDRREAIGYAVGKREAGDVILIAGKGHETYQEIQGVRYPMDDRELVKRCTQI